MMYGTFFYSDKWTIGFDIDGAPVTKVNKTPVQKKTEVSPMISDSVSVYREPTHAQVVNDYLKLAGNPFVIKRSRDYRYLTYLNPNDPSAGRVPVVYSYNIYRAVAQQFWFFEPQPGNLYKIKCGDQYLMSYKNPDKTYTTVLRGPGIATGDYLWQILPKENGLCLLKSSKGGYLEFRGRSVEGEPVFQADTKTGLPGQEWQLIQMDGVQKVMTNFDPVRHGFRFANTFINTRFVADVEWSFGGRCAGMAYAVLDYYFNNIPIPSQTGLPTEGSVLGTYIGMRQEQSTNRNVDRILEFNFNVGGSRTMEFFNWGLQGFGGGRLQQIRAELDAGRPIPVILYNPTGDMIRYPHHSVVVIGYSLGRYTGDLGNYKQDFRLYVYDPNFPGEIKMMIANIADLSNPRYAYINAHKGNGEVTEWLTYFPNAGFAPRSPLSNNDITGCPAEVKRLTGKNFRGTTNNNANFKCVIANRADFYGATFMQVDFERALLDSTIFHGANVRNSNFSYTRIKGGNFYGADLKDTRFLEARISFTDFRGSDMKLSQLERANLINSNFSNADLHRTILTKANCSGSHFTKASLSHTVAVAANFSATQLSSTNFQNANLQRAIFRNAIIDGTDFRNADLRGADFTGANIIRAPLLEGANLTGVIGLNR
jgi:uncharacterized protein YjbI with pentapeptide repeats